jgi:cytoskeletal protein CcmA (bactofilin family)
MKDTPNQNNLSKDVHVKGSIKFANELTFDGNLEGEITSVDGVLTVGENANVRGDVMSKIAIVNGKVQGNITVWERCELHARSQLIGDLKAVHLVIEAGATFVGKSQITPIRGAIKDVAVAQKGEPQEIGSPR